MRLTCLDSVRGWSEAGSTLECSREMSVIAKAQAKAISVMQVADRFSKSVALRIRNQGEILAERAAQRAPETSGHMDWMNACLFRRLTQR